MRTRVGSLFLVGVIVVAMAACDTSPPTFTVQLDAAFVVGAQIEASDSGGGEDLEAYTWDIPRRLTWLAEDDQECRVRYDLLLVYAGSEPGALLENTRQTHHGLLTNDYDGTYGGGSGSTDGWRVVARDCAGNTATSDYPRASFVWQENGFGPTYPLVDAIEYTGPWTVQTGAWTSGGQQRFTTSPGASVSFTWDDYIEGQHVGLVMPKGPGRGSAAILVDDVLVGTVDTNAPANDNRRVMFDHAMPAGSHTITIVNLATVGHPRIDIDAFLV